MGLENLFLSEKKGKLKEISTERLLASREKSRAISLEKQGLYCGNPRWFVEI